LLPSQWRNCGAVSDEIARGLRRFAFAQNYLFGDATLAFETDDPALAARFDEVYRECAVDAPGAMSLRCTIASHPERDLVGVAFDERLCDVARFVAYVFPERGFASEGTSDDGWSLIGPGESPLAAISPEGTLLVSRFNGWQSFVGNVAVNLLLRKQDDVLFFHGATCSVSGRGVMITGPKSSGKTTTSLALASRGHLLLGDEIAAIRAESWEALPFRRALSIRNGPRASAVDEALSGAESTSEIFPDGQPRIRVRASSLFREEAQPVPLNAAFFLRRFAPSPCIEPVRRTRDSLRLLQPLGCTLWNNGTLRPRMELLSFFERTRCYFLDPGQPEKTAVAIERCLEESCP
jgi:hypothetical protein